MISVDSFMLIALVVASPWIIIFAWKTIVMFYKWTIGGLLAPDDNSQGNG